MRKQCESNAKVTRKQCESETKRRAVRRESGVKANELGAKESDEKVMQKR
jgi:hypothetical protein